MIDRSAVLVIRLDRGTKDVLARLAAQNERTLSGEVRRLVKAAAAVELVSGQQGEEYAATTDSER